MSLVTMKHVRQAGMCSSGARKFFESRGLNWSDFLKNGIESEKIVATGDGMALKVVEVANGQQS